MKYFVGIDLGTTNSDRFESGGTANAFNRLTTFNQSSHMKYSIAQQKLGKFFCRKRGDNV